MRTSCRLLAGMGAFLLLLGACGSNADDPGTAEQFTQVELDTTSTLAVTTTVPGEQGPTDDNRRLVSEVADAFEARWAVLDAECSHHAVFAYTYLQTTLSGLRALETDQLPNPDRLTALLVPFARLYTDTFDAWADRAPDLPGAWLVALDAAEGRDVRGIGDVLLGMNAHIGHDLVLALLEAWPEFLDGPPVEEFEQIDLLLTDLMTPLVDDLAARYDPTIGLIDLPLAGIDEFGSGEALRLWRRQAWDAAVEIQAASDDERASLLDELDRRTTLQAELIRSVTSYFPLDPAIPLRETHCQANHRPLSVLQ